MDQREIPTDDDLAAAAAAGTRDAFEDLVVRYGAPVLAVVEKQVGEHHAALDLTQEIWIKVFRALPRFKPGGSFRSWLFSIALNHVRDARRREKRSRVVYIDEYRTPPVSSRKDDPRGRTEEQAAIELALGRVPEPFRSAVMLVDVLELSYDEAARSLECAVGTVKSRVSRGRFAFREVYEQGEEGQGQGVRAPGGSS